MLTASLPVNISRYEIKSLIGRGGMGDLYLARDPNTNRLVALKLLNASLTSSDLRERFAREARALAALNHPNIVVIYDYGEYQGSPFIVMEYVRGETLAEKIKRRAPLTVAQKLKLMAELCAGLGQAHEAGIIHRDIKPANLMVEQHGRLKVLDFGIARVAEGNMTRVGLQMTQVNMRIGTPGYMSPEQIEGGEIDCRSDLFAVGTVLYELLSYREAFSGGTTRQIENKVLEEQPAPLASFVQGIDPDITAIVARALEKDRNRRFQSAEEFEQALEHQRWRLGPAASTPPPARPTPPPAPTPGRSSRDARANAAYQRSLAVYEEGAEEAARRFAIEALAEEPNHLGARALLERLDPHAWVATAVAAAPSATSLPPTQVAPPGSISPTIVRTGVHSGPPSPWEALRPLWERYRWPMLVAASVVAVVGLVLTGVWLSGAFASGRSLTIARPTGGTLTGNGITCGTLGSNCTATLARGEMVALNAQPDAGFVFAGYTGDCAPGGMTTMTVARTCGATFNRIPEASGGVSRVLTITPPKGGTIVSNGITCGTLGSECSTTHPDGAAVKLDVLVDQGYVFARYTGACAPDGQTTMIEARTCGAVFTQGAPARAQAAAGSVTPSVAPRKPRQNAVSAPGPTVPQLPPAVAPASTPVVAAPGSEGTTVVSPVGAGNNPTPPPTPPDVTAKNAIQKTLTDYCAAYESLDADALKQVFPKASNTVRDQFRDLNSVECTLALPPQFVQLDPTAGTAKVQVDVKQTFDRKVGGIQKQETTATVTLLRPQPRGNWYIDTMFHKPKR